MVRETLAALNSEVQQARAALGISQNEVARRAGIHPSILSRVLRNELTSDPAVTKLREWLASPTVRAAERLALGAPAEPAS